MAAINSLTYLVYSVLTLAANNKPTTDPSLNAWEIGSESQVTEAWNQEPHYVTGKYNEESCPAGETWSDCDAGCETTCENVGKPVICPRMCVPGCVCEEPGTVRGPDKKCIHPPLCPSADGMHVPININEFFPTEPPVTPYDIPVTLSGEWEPNRHYESKKR
ncbi:hypothetical protein AVEN_39010-1 [Araneus ventricosus]|uniref:TIL domain-containing protein n=1 Tax=Araneus ventricosus TaxID=182803 RepID=A0A4Y2DRK6_ARAVE|nr:hypothetical protein AVEN_39010-1 [Araneus ventricosus]